MKAVAFADRAEAEGVLVLSGFEGDIRTRFHRSILIRMTVAPALTSLNLARARRSHRGMHRNELYLYRLLFLPL